MSFANFDYKYTKKSLEVLVLEAFDTMGNCFNKADLIKRVNNLLEQPYYDSTIMTKLVYLKSQKRINYTCMDQYRGIYCKKN